MAKTRRVTVRLPESLYTEVMSHAGDLSISEIIRDALKNWNRITITLSAEQMDRIISIVRKAND